MFRVRWAMDSGFPNGGRDRSLGGSGDSSNRGRAQISRVSILLADDQPVYLHGLCALLCKLSRFNIVEAHVDGISALQSIRQFRPRIAVLGMSLPEFSGIELLKLVQDEGLRTRVVLLATTQKEIAAAIRQGPWGIIPKQTPLDCVTKCLSAIAGGERCFPPGLVDHPSRREAKWPNESEKIGALLTEPELQISFLVAQGLSNAHIACRLGVSEAAVKTELYNAYRKLGGLNRPSLMTLADRQHRSLPARVPGQPAANRASLARHPPSRANGANLPAPRN
ncbi:MAG: response regulator transcription factor [Hyphomicrobiales bacterium]|nr:response regulator transcription factor [Hyphomicrobiales bacterium]MBV9433904.1 response regulator transcription factor [Hyphomicrobiales bacterium]